MIKQWDRKRKHTPPALACRPVETFMWIRFDVAGGGSSDG